MTKPKILKNKIRVAYMLRQLSGYGTQYEHADVKWWKLTVTFQQHEYYICFQYYETKPGVDRVDIRSTKDWQHLKPTQIKWLEKQLELKINGTHNGRPKIQKKKVAHLELRARHVVES